MSVYKHMPRLEGILPLTPPHKCISTRISSFQQSRRHEASLTSRRRLHTSKKQGDVAASFPEDTANLSVASSNTSKPHSASDLAHLPLSQILRSYLITAISSSPYLLAKSSSLLRRMLDSKTVLFSIEKNPVMRALLWETFYKQFCAGEKDSEVAKMCEELRAQGFAGVILEYALEVVGGAEGNEAVDVEVWRKGILETIAVAKPGDFIGLKWSGMGATAFKLMSDNASPSKLMDGAMREVCDAAAKKGVALLPSAEESWTLEAFHRWSINLQREYNVNGKVVIYTTYQCYLRQMPSYVAQHLEMAKKEGFVLGAKFVRGAYLATEKRDLIHPTIEATHAAYDALAAALITRRFNSTLPPTSAPTVTEENWPSTHVMIASHNMASVQTAVQLRREQVARGEQLTPTTFAQLQGMADEVSCSLIAASKAGESSGEGVKEKVYKCTTWGPMYECLNYLLRRASENKDAASRTLDTRVAMQAELWRRLKSTFSLG